MSLSTVKQQDGRRQNKAKKLIEMFEKQQHKEQFLKDLSQTQKIHRFSEESQRLLADMNHTEIFEFCKKKKKTAKQQCLDCNTFLENRNNLLQLRKKLEVSAKSNNSPERQLRLHVDPWLCHKEELQQSCKTRTIRKTEDVLPGEADAEKGTSSKAWAPPSDTFKMARQ